MKTVINGTYPITPAYNVIYEPGAGGSFFAGLLNMFLSLTNLVPDKSQYFDTDLPKLYNYYNVNNSLLYNLYFPNPEVRYQIPKYKIAGPLNPYKPVVYDDHKLPDYDDYFKVFPMGKLIFLTATEEEEALIQGNLFFNIVCRPQNTNTFKSWLAQYPDITAETPDELTVEDTFNILRNPSQVVHYQVIYNPFTPPEKYSDKIFQFRVKDIFNVKDEVLQRLSAITEKPVTPAIHDYYDRYLEIQQELITTKMPWVTL